MTLCMLSWSMATIQKKKTATSPETSDRAQTNVQPMCYDTGHAVLEYGHSPRPQILSAKKDGNKHRNFWACLDTHAAGVFGH